MHFLKIFTHFSSAHYLNDYPGNCAKLHGHNWKVFFIFEVKQLNELGMGYDFKELSKIVKKQVDHLDHQLLNELTEFKDKNPTAENIAEYIFKQVDTVVIENLKLYEVEVFESDKYSVIYRR